MTKKSFGFKQLDFCECIFKSKVRKFDSVIRVYIDEVVITSAEIHGIDSKENDLISFSSEQTWANRSTTSFFAKTWRVHDVLDKIGILQTIPEAIWDASGKVHFNVEYQNMDSLCLEEIKSVEERPEASYFLKGH